MPIEGIVDTDFVNQQVQATAGLSGSGQDDGFDPDMFLNILMVQLQNQSPFDTVGTDKILEQQAILTEVEQATQQTQALKNLEEKVDVSLLQIAETLGEINSTINTLVVQQQEGE